MQEWSEGFWAAVSIIICSILVVMLISFFNIGKQTANLVYADRAVTEEMQEYLRFDNYDGTVVHSQDITSVILEYRGNPGVIVNLNSGARLQWDSFNNLKSSDYASAAITMLIPVSSQYDAQIVKDANGSVVSFIFTER